MALNDLWKTQFRFLRVPWEYHVITTLDAYGNSTPLKNRMPREKGPEASGIQGPHQVLPDVLRSPVT